MPLGAFEEVNLFHSSAGGYSIEYDIYIAR